MEPDPLGLPEDLELEIFETLAMAEPFRIPSLLLVAFRVKLWIEPLLYRTIAITADGLQRHSHWTPEVLISAIRSKPVSFIQKFVRIENLNIIGIQKVALHLQLISILPLRRLAVSLGNLLGDSPIDFSHPLFSQLTHLEVSDQGGPSGSEDDMDVWAGLSKVPHLAHFGFASTRFLPICAQILRTCRSLRVFLRCGGHSHGLETALRALKWDVRFVSMYQLEYTKDCQMGAHASEDSWSRCEDFIAKRRSGEIDRELFFLLRFISNCTSSSPTFCRRRQ
ncbi:hypothetical protein B0H17DRAFT_1201773 [Mycena rosella]|uniref:Uncharacterized protein n=1 Tax=Mycena rosella TaxID=1033263 RepID=A0AAD7GGT6_MYCRO|nr:hypothetical protein B0H17DRAFT_1201773 [Mycena rosella]